MVKKWFKVLVIALGLATFAGTSEAALTAVDPGPYTAATGFFPLWYTDSTNTTLDLCLSKAVSSRVAGAPGAPSYMCTLLPNPGIFDDALPIVFPYNFPDEAFWFTGDAAIVGSGIDLQYGAALEAAFGGGVPAPGDQVSFARIRIRADVPTVGSYTVTHPYGVETFNVTAVDAAREINMTRDIGIGAPGIFTGALNGDIGPFLQSVNGPYTETNPDTGATEIFVGDPNLFEGVTGSPFGTNFVRIQGPNGIDLTTDRFAVSGRKWNGLNPTAVAVDRSSYTRTPLGDTGIEVFAASTPTATVTFRETLLGTEFPMTRDGLGKFFAQDLAAAPLPPYVIVTATDTTTTPTPLASPLVDVVKITQALYSQADQTLVIQAKSSDEQAPIPTLRVLGLPGTLQSASGTTTQQLFVSGVTEPPATVTVKSSAGGSDTEPVVVVPVANANPVAVNDSATTDQGVAVTVNVLANDTDPDENLPLAVDSVTQPANGSVVNNGISVTYTPNGTFTGTDTFTYQASDTRGGLSNAALVTVTVRAPNQLPVAVNDSATTPQGRAVTIAVLGNDSDPDGNLPLAVANLTTPANGTASISGTSVIYTPRAGFAGTDSFTYQAQDTRGGLSNAATVTVTVTNAAPIASADTATTTAGVPVNIDVLANDNDPDGNTPLAVTNLNQPANGTAVLQGNNTVTYTSNGGFTGTDSFTYQARDTLGALSNAATVTVTVNAAAVDLNITGFSTTGTVRLSRNQSVAITLRVRNIGAVNGSVPATVVGVQNGAEIYRVPQQVNDPLGGGSTSFNFPAYLPSAVGNINWTVTVQDTNPSSATATTNVRP